MRPKRAGVTMKAESLPGVRVGSPREPSGLLTASQEQVRLAGEGQHDEGTASRAQAETAPADGPPPPARFSSHGRSPNLLSQGSGHPLPPFPTALC